MVASASLQSSAAAVAVASSPSHKPRHRHSNLLPSLPSIVTFAPPSILNSSSRLTLRYRKQQRWMHDSKIGKAQESTRLYSLWRQVTCKIDKALLPEFSSGQLKCFSCLKRARGHGFCVKSHASNIFKNKSTFPMQSHSFGSSILKRIIAPQATLGPDEPHVASTSWPDIALEKQRLGFWDPEAEKAELQRFLNSELPSHPKLQRRQLKNGLRYIILLNKIPANRFEAHMEVHVGSIDEEDDEQGIAHMIEHVAFLGSKKREKLLRTGARSNAYTDFHHTVFHIHSPTSAKDSDGDLLPFLLDALNEDSFPPQVSPF
ncbi:hypothetical protein J5N97_021523 [Dioscorea zingiberensis]|uniref:Peptidase M16 N-terminal domain-containing protein n=1 Tax=Dioscorea zingiberensis TaxID=325984 RepID=A0A9D5HEE5_9LILI|nr:hypothetical protein J5N97_021523 [Dioscorea zingiberensis]